MSQTNIQPLSGYYFATSSTSVNILFKEEGLQKSDRFSVSLTVSSDNLDKDGFVIDFLKLSQTLETVKNDIQDKHFESISETHFSPKNLLNFLYTKFTCYLDKNVIIKTITIENENECYGYEV